MYKTIRHGENSLQYTILPQNDDCRVEGKLTSNTNCGSMAVTQPSKQGRKRSFFAYLGLLFVCTVIIGAIFIPFLVSVECLPNPSDWFLKTQIAMPDKKEDISNILNSSSYKTESTTNSILSSNEPISTARSLDILTEENIFTIPLLSENNLKMNSYAVVLPNKVTTARWKKDEIPTIATQMAAVTSRRSLGTTFFPIRAASVETLRSMTSKKPIILPVLAKTNSVLKENGILVAARPKPDNWIRSHWPFIDPSNFFQWAGYKSEDSIILPAILGVALIGMILIITLCLVARNKKVIVASVRKRNRNDIEEAGEDNTTLLTAGNVSEED